MSEITVEWIAMLLFLVLFVGAVFTEVFWLIKKEWTSAGRAVAYVLITDLFSFTLGSVIAFVIFGIMLMMTFGPAGRGSRAPESAYWAVSLIAIIFPPLLLLISKRLFLLIFKIKSGKTAWLYTLVSSVLLVLFVLVPPPLIYFMFIYLLK